MVAISGKILGGDFFERSSDLAAKELLGKIIIRKLDGKILKARIVEDEAYFDEKDPASWARFGLRKDNAAMWDSPGTILVKNVHKHFMLNFVTDSEGKAGAVLIRAVEPLNFDARCSGPGLLTAALRIDKSFNGKKFSDEFFVENSDGEFEVDKSFRIGVKNDLKRQLRFYIKGNKFVSKGNGQKRNNREN